MSSASLSTFVGKRSRQEDCSLFCGKVYLSDSLRIQRGQLDDNSVFCVCDGIGSLASGHEFSRFVCECVLDVNHDIWTDSSLTQLAIEKIQEHVINKFDAKGGTTLTIGCLSLGNFYIANAGNSRAYLLRANKLLLLSHDHTYANELVQRGMIDQSELATHHLASYLSFGIGTSFSDNWSKSKLDIVKFSVCLEDRILLCTDGCYGEITEHELITFIQQNDATTAVDRSTFFLKNSTEDNMTAIVVCI